MFHRAAVVIAAVATLAPRLAHAERVVTGSVVDHATGMPVVGALVAIGSVDAATEDDGTFRATNVAGGRLDVVVIADGYRAYFGSTRAGATLAIRLEPEGTSSEVIRVRGRMPVTPPMQLDTQAIRDQPGAGNDVLRALQSLPGVARTPFGLGGLALRGTAPRDTKVFLDGIEVPLLYHFGGIASFIPTAAIDDVVLEPSGAGVRYGRGLGGVAVATTRTGRRDRWRVGGELSLIHAATIAEGPGPMRGSWLVGVRRSYFDAIEEAAQLDLALAPRYADAQLRWESGDGRWMALLFGSDDSLRFLPSEGSSGGIDTSNVKSLSYASRFVRLGARYRAVHGATSVMVLPSVGVDHVDARANHEGVDKGMERVTVPLHLRAEVATAALRGTLTVGFDGGAQLHSYDMNNTPPPTAMDPSPDDVVHRTLDRWASDVGVWAEQSWFVAGDRVEIRPGLRADRFGLSEQVTLDPRITVHEVLCHGLRLTQSLGRYHAPPLVTDYDPIFGDRIMPGSSSTQVTAGMKQQLGDDKELSATVYYNRLGELPVDAITSATPASANGSTESGGLLGISRELVDTQFGSYSYREGIGSGHAYGLELIGRRTAGAWTGWVAYTFARSFRRNPARGDTTAPYVLDQPHALTIVGSTALGKKWRLGGRFRFTTGNPLTPVAAAYLDASGDWVPVDGAILSQRLPDFMQLDVRLDRAWRRPSGLWKLYIDVQNITNRSNAEGVTYNTDFSRRSFTTGLPIFPSIGVEVIP
ncbi:MAG: TonB-dependent receptor [Deltaproteobacteria bacterium]|nr:TonB-dependent receptor [Deltaproteobacteria bacterium]